MRCLCYNKESSRENCCLRFRRKKTKVLDKQISGLSYINSCSCPLITEQPKAIFPTPLEKRKTLDVFQDTLDIIPVDEKVFSINISFDESTNPLFPIEQGAMKVLHERRYSVRSIISPPPTLIANFSIDVNGNSGAGPIIISSINNLILEVSVNIFGRSSIYSIVKPSSLEVAPQGVTLGDGPMTIYLRAYYQIPPIPLVFHNIIPANSLLSPVVLFRLSGNVLYNSLKKTITATYNNDLNIVPDGYVQSSHIEILSL